MMMSLNSWNWFPVRPEEKITAGNLVVELASRGRGFRVQQYLDWCDELEKILVFLPSIRLNICFFLDTSLICGDVDCDVLLDRGLDYHRLV